VIEDGPKFPISFGDDAILRSVTALDCASWFIWAQNKLLSVAKCKSLRLNGKPKSILISFYDLRSDFATYGMLCEMKFMVHSQGWFKIYTLCLYGYDPMHKLSTLTESCEDSQNTWRTRKMGKDFLILQYWVEAQLLSYPDCNKYWSVSRIVSKGIRQYSLIQKN